MSEKERQKFADEIRRQGRDWSFRRAGGQKVFTDAKVQKEWEASHGN